MKTLSVLLCFLINGYGLYRAWTAKSWSDLVFPLGLGLAELMGLACWVLL